MANKNFQNYAVAGNNVALTYDNVNDTVTIDVNVDKTDVGLGNVDNTSDINKPISTLVQNALNLKQDAITLTTTGSSGASTFAANVLNIPTYSLSGLGGQPLATNLTSISALTFASTSFVKMTAAGTFALDTNTYLTAEADTLASVTGRGNTTTNAITVGSLVANGSMQVGTGGGIINNPSGSDFSITTGGSTANLNFFAKGQVPLRIFANNDSSYAPFNFNSISSSRSFIGYFADWNGATYRARSTTAGVLEFNNGVWTLTSNTGLTSMSTFTPTVIMTIFSSGNIGINTTTDSGFRLDVNGTARIQNQLTTTGSITAASAIARGVYMNQILVASANGDTLVGLDINPTFTLGAFTGTKQIALRLNNAIQFTGTPTSLSDTNAIYGNNLSTTFLMASGPEPISSSANGGFFLLRGNTYSAISGQRGWTVIASGLVTSPTGNEGCISLMVGNTSEKFRIFPNGNITIQNGGTFTDAGFRLDVNGTARVQNVLTLGNLATDPTGANGMIYYNTTSNVFRKYINGAWANL